MCIKPLYDILGMMNGGYEDPFECSLSSIKHTRNFKERVKRKRKRTGNTLSKMADESLPKESLRGGWNINSR